MSQDIVSPAETDNNSPSEGIMPFTDVIKFCRRIYLYDKNTMKVSVCRPESVDLAECPEQVLKAILEIQKGKVIEIANPLEEEPLTPEEADGILAAVKGRVK